MMKASAVKPTVAVIETLDYPRATCVRIAQAFARTALAHVLVCHWHSLEFTAGGVTVRGPVERVTTGGARLPAVIEPALEVQALFFYGPNSGVLTHRDTAALDRLAAAGIEVHGAPLYIVVDRVMLEASRRGVVTNALGRAREWGPKHQQELKLRRYERATGQVVSRPETYIARPHELPEALAIFGQRGESCLVKPSFGEGGQGIRVVRPGEPFTPSDNSTLVVQPLIPEPLLVEGYKADIRCYLLIDPGDERASRRVGPIFLRRAAMPYVPMSLASEITNTSYRFRHGFPADMRPLHATSGISADLRAQIIAQLESVASALVNAYFWNSIHDSTNGTSGSEGPNRAILFGVDVLVAGPWSKPRLLFLETNPFPGFYRNLPDCDQAVDQMLSWEYLPVLASRGPTPGAPLQSGPTTGR
jgi:hypothetical protein